MKTFLITGANRGIGLEMTQQALERGDQVFATCRDPANAPYLTALQPVYTTRLSILPMDVTDPRSIDAVSLQLKNQPIDVLVNNAGILGPKNQTPLDMDFDGFAETLAVNTIAPLRVTQAFLPQLEMRPHGRIITMSSWTGSMAQTGYTSLAYRASKAAVNKVMQGLATELHVMGIIVAVMHPGWVRTDMGGRGADITAEESVAGMLEIIDGLTLKQSGKFFNYDGDTLPF